MKYLLSTQTIKNTFVYVSFEGNNRKPVWVSDTNKALVFNKQLGNIVKNGILKYMSDDEIVWNGLKKDTFKLIEKP